MSYDPVVELKSLVLDRLRIASSQVVSQYVIRNAELDVIANIISDDLMLHLSSHVLADRLEPSSATVSFETYASLWQHIKAVWFPRKARWLRRPVRYKTITQTVTARNFATFPECRNDDYPRDLGRPVHLALFDSAFMRVKDVP